MINQQHFSPPVKVYTPIKQVFPAVVHTPPVHKPAKLGERIALHAGDKLDGGEIVRSAKELSLAFCKSQLLRLNLHTPKWVYKRTKDLDSLTFPDLYLTQGFKATIDECHFAMDAGGAVICFNIKAFKVENYLQNWDNQVGQVYTILDVFSIGVIEQDEVKRRFGGNSRYLEFLSLKGHEAC